MFLCDDDYQTVKKYAQLITKAADENHIEIMISAFTREEDLLFDLIESPNLADIIYLDILMGKTNGMDTAKKLRYHGCKAEIIFLTSSEDYVYDAFDIVPVQYLLKDSTTEGKFEQVFLRAVSLSANKKQEMIIFEAGGISKIIPLNEISFLEIWKRIVEVHYSDGKSDKFYRTLENLEEGLKDKDFIRIHRSYIIHLPYIAKFEKQNVFLTTGKCLPIGVTYSEYVRQAFSEYVVRSRNLSFLK